MVFFRGGRFGVRPSSLLGEMVITGTVAGTGAGTSAIVVVAICELMRVGSLVRAFGASGAKLDAPGVELDGGHPRGGLAPVELEGLEPVDVAGAKLAQTAPAHRIDVSVACACASMRLLLEKEREI